MQQLVTEIEGGSRQGRLSERCKALLEELKESAEGGNFDSIVLGCTHFSHLEAEIEKRLPNTSIISPARAGALALIEKLKLENGSFCRENGKTVYIRS